MPKKHLNCDNPYIDINQNCKESGCKNCQFYSNEICQDNEIWVNKNNEPICRYNPSSHKKAENLQNILIEAKEIYKKDINDIYSALSELATIMMSLHERIKKLEEK